MIRHLPTAPYWPTTDPRSDAAAAAVASLSRTKVTPAEEHSMSHSTTIASAGEAPGGQSGLPAALARLRATAEAAGIVVFDDLREPWPDDSVAVYVSGRGFAAFNPAVDDHGPPPDLIPFV